MEIVVENSNGTYNTQKNDYIFEEFIIYNSIFNEIIAYNKHNKILYKSQIETYI